MLQPLVADRTNAWAEKFLRDQRKIPDRTKINKAFVDPLPAETKAVVQRQLSSGLERSLRGVGSGGVADVHVVENGAHRLAVKMARPSLPGRPKIHSRHFLLHEAMMFSYLGRCKIPALVKFWGYAEQQACLPDLFVTDYITRPDSLLRDLALRCKRKDPMSYGLIIEIMKALAYNVARFHSCEVLHRDLKPDNIIVNYDRYGAFLGITMFDLGLARLEGTLLMVEGPNSPVWGSPSYLSVNLWQKGFPTYRDDLFALDMIFYDLFAGRLAAQKREPLPKPAMTGSFNTLRRIEHLYSLLPFKFYRLGLPDQLEYILFRAAGLTEQPYQSALMLWLDLLTLDPSSYES